MLRQIWLMTWPTLANMYGVNALRHGHDRVKRRRTAVLLAAFVLIGIMLAVYSGALAYGYCYMGIGDVVPVYAFCVTGLVTLLSGAFRAGGTLFDASAYEKQACLPVSRAAIALSRLLSMYVFCALPCTLIALPALGVYGVFSDAEAGYWIMAVIGAPVSLLIPLALASALGAGVAAVSRRMRHKNALMVAASMAFVLLVMALPAFIMNSGIDGMQLISATADMVRLLGRAYLPAALFANAIAAGWLRFLAACGLSAAVFALAAWFICRNYERMVENLRPVSARAARSTDIAAESAATALYKKELRLYLSSSIYVMNTMVGYVLMIAASVALAVLGAETLEAVLGAPGMLSRIVPFALAAMLMLSPSTACAISIEGRRWPIQLALPVTAAQLFGAKAKVMLTFAGPSALAAAFIAAVGLGMNAAEGLLMAAMLASYALFSAVTGLAVNAKLPMFDWESETTAVKQSASVLVSMLIALAATLIPLGAAFALRSVHVAVIMAAATAVCLGATALGWRRLTRIELSDI